MVRNVLVATVPIDADRRLYAGTSSRGRRRNLSGGWRCGAVADRWCVSTIHGGRAPSCVVGAPVGSRGRWPALANGFTPSDNTKTALAATRGVHVRESIRLEVPLADVYGFWPRLENLRRFMTHLNRVIENSDRKSHWVAVGPAGLAVGRPPTKSCRGWPKAGSIRCG